MISKEIQKMLILQDKANVNVHLFLQIQAKKL